MKTSEKGILYIALNMDNNLIVGDVKVIDEAIAAFKENRLVLKLVKGLQNYLS